MDEAHRYRVLLLLGCAFLAAGTILKLGTLDARAPDGPASVRLRIDDPDGTTLLDTGLQLEANDATALGALMVSSERHGFDVRLQEYAGMGTLVVQIFDHVNEGACGWNYFVNGTWGPVAADRYPVDDGDVVHWRWSCGA